MAILVVVTGKVTVPAVPVVSVPLCAPTATVFGKMIIVNAGEVVPLIVSVRFVSVAAAVAVLLANVSTPLPPLMVTLPETVTPAGKLATVAA